MAGCCQPITVAEGFCLLIASASGCCIVPETCSPAPHGASMGGLSLCAFNRQGRGKSIFTKAPMPGVHCHCTGKQQFIGVKDGCRFQRGGGHSSYK